MLKRLDDLGVIISFAMQAHTIFHAHVDGLQDEASNGDGKQKLLYDPERSGAEWWTLVLDAHSAEGKEKRTQNETDDDDEEEDDEVGMHFDADYGLEAQMPNFLLHPRVATITYLSDIGVPTLILDKRSPAPSDVDKKGLAGDINKAWLSHPSFGKHVAFDGRLLHGAPGEYFPAADSTAKSSEPKAKRAKVDQDFNNGKVFSGKRITFLVNIWLNHCPIDAEILDDEVVSKLTTSTVWEDQSKEKLKADESYTQSFQCLIKDIAAPDELGGGLKLKSAAAKSDGPAGVEEDLVICNRHITMRFGATMKDFHDASSIAAVTGSAEITMGEGVISLEVGNEATSDEEDDEEEDN